MSTLKGAQDVIVSGDARFGEVDSPAGASYVLFTDADAQAVVAQPGRYDAVLAVAASGVDEEELASRFDGALAERVERLEPRVAELERRPSQ